MSIANALPYVLVPILLIYSCKSKTAVEECHLLRDARGWDLKTFEKGCDEGDFECCSWAADAVMGMDRVLDSEPDAKRAAAFARKACDKAKAIQYEYAATECASAVFYQCAAERNNCEQRCEQGDATACHDLSRWHRFGFRHGSPGAGDPKQELVYLKKACEKKHREACVEAAIMECKADDEKCKKACEAGDAVRCFALGRLYRRGEGVSENRQKAERLEAKACELNREVDRSCRK